MARSGIPILLRAIPFQAARQRDPLKHQEKTVNSLFAKYVILTPQVGTSDTGAM